MKVIAIASLFAGAMAAQIPAGWSHGGTQARDYEISLDRTMTFDGKATVHIKSKPGARTDGFGTLAQYFTAAKFAGKRVRFSAELRTDDVRKEDGTEGWAGLWLRIDKEGRPLILDNMHQTGPDRAVKGTTSWRNYAVVLDVDPDATGIGMGAILAGSGAVWISNVKFEVVGTDVPVTLDKRSGRNGPENLGFEKGGLQ